VVFADETLNGAGCLSDHRIRLAQEGKNFCQPDVSGLEPVHGLSQEAVSSKKSSAETGVFDQ